MHRLAVGEDNHTKPSPSRFPDFAPTTYATVGLDALVLWMRDYSGNPRIADQRSVAAMPDAVEVLGGFHSLASQRLSGDLG